MVGLSRLDDYYAQIRKDEHYNFDFTVLALDKMEVLRKCVKTMETK